MPLNACVRMLAPASNAASAVAKSAPVCPTATRDAGVDEPADRLGRAGVLGRDRDLAQRAVGRREQPLHRVGVGRAQQGGVVRAAELGVEERPLEVRAEHARVACGDARR